MAFGAEVGGAAAEDDALDGGFAADTGVILTTIDAVKQLEATCFAVGVDVIAQ